MVHYKQSVYSTLTSLYIALLLFYFDWPHRYIQRINALRSSMFMVAVGQIVLPCVRWTHLSQTYRSEETSFSRRFHQPVVVVVVVGYLVVVVVVVVGGGII